MPNSAILSIKEVLRQRGSSWEIISSDYVLKEFLSRGGDYGFWLKPDGSRQTDIFECSGGNCIDWRLVDDIVELRDQFAHSNAPPTLIKLDILWDIIEKLAASRKSK